MTEPLASNDRHWRDLAVFFALFAAYLLLILYPILRADRYINDDLVRATLGNYGWNHNGRHLSNLLMRVLELGSERAVDIAPLPQLLAIAVLAWIGVLMARRFAITSPLLAVLIAFPLGAQPFFLENLAYRFDAVCMSLAMLFAALPVLALGGSNAVSQSVKPMRWWWALLCLIACLSLYQPAINVFLIFVLLEAFDRHKQQTSWRNVLIGLALRGLQVLTALLIYRWLVTPSLQDWVLQHSQTIHPISEWQVVVANLGVFYGYIVDSFSQRSLRLLTLLSALGALVPVAACIKYAWVERDLHPVWGRMMSPAFALVLVALAGLCIAGAMLLLKSPVLMPRVLVAIGALISAALIAQYLVLPQRPRSLRWQSAVGLTWALVMAVHAAAFGNALAAQRRYEAAIAATLADDLAQLQSRHPLRGYVVEGSAGWSPITRHVVRQFPVVGKLILPYLHHGDLHTRNFLRPYFTRLDGKVLEAVQNDDRQAIGFNPCGATPVQVRAAYALYIVDDAAFVHFGAAGAENCDTAD